MLAVRINGSAEATWDMQAREWLCEDLVIKGVLDSYRPEEVYDVHAAMLEGGTQALALKGAQEIFKAGALEILVNTEPPYPPEPPPGTEY
jgi:hypothetical protein